MEYYGAFCAIQLATSSSTSTAYYIAETHEATVNVRYVRYWNIQAIETLSNTIRVLPASHVPIS